MPRRDIIAIGASAGGVEALQKLASGLPPGFPASLFIVLHIYSRARSFLPQIVSNAGPLPAMHPQNGQPIEPGRIYIAPPNQHLVVEQGHVHLSSGPKEQHQRPCINVTFRSAAAAYGERVAGVVLTGEMDDGVAGQWEIKRRGGIVIVQNPEEALFPSMPLSVLREMEADYTARLAAIPPLLCRLAAGNGESKLEIRDSKAIPGNEHMEPRLTDLTCPECRGTIWEIPRENGAGRDYRCRVGHTYSPNSMLAEHSATQEKALYSAVVALEEGASLATRLAGEFEPATGARLLDEARERSQHAEAIRRILRERQAFTIE